MKNILIKSIAWMLSVAILFSLIPVNNVRAEAKVQEEITNSLNYIYINQAEQSYGDEQNIVVSWGDGTEDICNLELVLENEIGEEQIISPVMSTDGIFLFTEYFEKGIYHVSKLKIETASEMREFSADDLEIDAYFTVDSVISEDVKSAYIEMESVPTTSIENEVVTIDSNNVNNADDQVADAILNASETLPMTFSGENEEDDDLVIVLDPGHDSKHAGAQGNGVKEEVVTLKIAQYCKAELKQYENVKVYMTRELATCPFPKSTGNIDDINKRVKWAAEKGADVFVSIHLNSALSTSAKGAEVYYSSSSTDGKKLSQKIQTELVKIGLYNREAKSGDAYAAIKAAKAYGFPGIIIEHCFISNSNDANKYLKSETGIKKLGVADAQGIAMHFQLKKIGTKQDMPEGSYVFKNAERFLSIQEDNSVIINEESSDITQVFELKNAGNQYYYIFDGENEKVVAEEAGKIILVDKAENSKSQKWAFYKADNGKYYLRTASGYYMEAPADLADKRVISSNKQNSKDTQKWEIEEKNGKLILNEVSRMVSAVYNDGKVTVKWETVPYAKGYQVYRKESGSNWSKVGTVKTLEYVDSTIVKGKTYYYTVRAYNEYSLSAYDSKGISVKIPAPATPSPTYIKYKTTATINYRTGPGTTYKKAGTLYKGKIVQVVKGYSKKANGYTWFKVKINNKTYYVASKYLKKVTTSKVTYIKYKTTATINYRTGPGTAYKKAGTLYKGKTVQVVKGYSKKANGYTWYKVKINNKTYYVASKYLKKL